MRNSGSTLTPSDPKIERTACAIRRELNEATIGQAILVEDQPLISSDPEKEIIMEAVPPQTMGDYSKRIDEG